MGGMCHIPGRKNACGGDQQPLEVELRIFRSRVDTCDAGEDVGFMYVRKLALCVNLNMGDSSNKLLPPGQTGTSPEDVV